MEMKISQRIFGIVVALTKNELTKICNEPGICHEFDQIYTQKISLMKNNLYSVFPSEHFFMGNAPDLQIL